ncbi:hypothetical protein Tco_0693935 [Tanacetum coccineum]
MDSILAVLMNSITHRSLDEETVPWNPKCTFRNLHSTLEVDQINYQFWGVDNGFLHCILFKFRYQCTSGNIRPSSSDKQDEDPQEELGLIGLVGQLFYCSDNSFHFERRQSYGARSTGATPGQIKLKLRLVESEESRKSQGDTCRKILTIGTSSKLLLSGFFNLLCSDIVPKKDKNPFCDVLSAF